MNSTDQRTPLARPLTKKDLDDQMVQVAAELLDGEYDAEDWTPVPISAAEFVRRMSRFMVYN
jgi:hypothetical protein